MDSQVGSDEDGADPARNENENAVIYHNYDQYVHDNLNKGILKRGGKKREFTEDLQAQNTFSFRSQDINLGAQDFDRPTEELE